MAMSSTTQRGQVRNERMTRYVQRVMLLEPAVTVCRHSAVACQDRKGATVGT